MSPRVNSYLVYLGRYRTKEKGREKSFRWLSRLKLFSLHKFKAVMSTGVCEAYGVETSF